MAGHAASDGGARVILCDEQSVMGGTLLSEPFARIDGMSEEESRPILEFLYAHKSRPEFTCRHRWAAGTLAVWDNRAAQHFALNDYHGQRREMLRLSIAGDRPV